MSSVVILGAGVMGSAFAFPLNDSGAEVHLVGTHLDDHIIAALKEQNPHPNLGLVLPAGVTAHYDGELGDLLEEETTLVVLGVSSAGVDWAARRLVESMSRPIPVLMLTKGLSVDGSGSLGILPDRVAGFLEDSGLTGVQVGAVGGPCIAREVAAGRHTGVTIGFRDPEILEQVRNELRAPYYHHEGTADLTGLEACAALKNFYAIAVGAATATASSKKETHNPAALIFSRAISEMAVLVDFIGGTGASVYGHPGVGDLYVTCQAGRNSRLGGHLGNGLTYLAAKEQYMADDTIEGAELALAIGPTLRRLISEEKLPGGHLPVAISLVEAICGDASLRIPWDAL